MNVKNGLYNIVKRRVRTYFGNVFSPSTILKRWKTENRPLNPSNIYSIFEIFLEIRKMLTLYSRMNPV